MTEPIPAAPARTLPVVGRRRARAWFPRNTPLRRAVYLAVVAGPLLAMLVLDQPVCLTALALGRPCPGCGLTRATFALLQGHFSEAIALHPLVPIVSPVVLVGFAVGSIRYIRTGRTDFRPWVAVVAGALAVALLVVWLARWLGAFGGPVAV